MSKKQEGKVNVSWGWGYVVSQAQISFVQGRMLTLIESFGMNEKQEKAVKDLICQELWRVYEGAVTLDSEQHTKLRVDSSDRIVSSGVKNLTPVNSVKIN